MAPSAWSKRPWRPSWRTATGCWRPPSATVRSTGSSQAPSITLSGSTTTPGSSLTWSRPCEQIPQIKLITEQNNFVFIPEKYLIVGRSDKCSCCCIIEIRYLWEPTATYGSLQIKCVDIKRSITIIFCSNSGCSSTVSSLKQNPSTNSFRIYFQTSLSQNIANCDSIRVGRHIIWVCGNRGNPGSHGTQKQRSILIAKLKALTAKNIPHRKDKYSAERLLENDIDLDIWSVDMALVCFQVSGSTCYLNGILSIWILAKWKEKKTFDKIMHKNT